MNEVGELLFAHVFSRIWIRETRRWSKLELAMAVSAIIQKVNTLFASLLKKKMLLYENLGNKFLLVFLLTQSIMSVRNQT